MKQRALVRLVACVATAIVTASTASAQPARRGVPAVAASAPIQGFSVVLILGSESPQRFTGDLPAGATRALSDLSDFLPYRSYRMLDSAWILNRGSGRTTARLRGVDEHGYQVNLDTGVAGPSRVTVKFALRDDDARRSYTDRSSADIERLEVALAVMNTELAALSKKLPPAHPDVMEKTRRIQNMRQELDAVRTRATAAWPVVVSNGQVIDTGFTMDVGETVVVGTSRLQGDTALIVLLTAVPSKP